MSYRIEYLIETTDEESVCHVLQSASQTLEDAEAEAVAQAESAKALGATGFQIRHLNAVDRVVAIGDFSQQELIRTAEGAA